MKKYCKVERNEWGFKMVYLSKEELIDEIIKELDSDELMELLLERMEYERHKQNQR